MPLHFRDRAGSSTTQKTSGGLTSLVCCRGSRRSLERLGGGCISGIGPCLLPVEAKDQALRPAMLYGVDTRATAEAHELTDRYGAEAILAVGGSPLTTQALGPKLVVVATPRARGIEEYTAAPDGKFVRGPAPDRRVRAGPSFRQSVQSSLRLELVRMAYRLGRRRLPGLELPRLAWPGEQAGAVSPKASSLTGLPAGIPVATGTTTRGRTPSVRGSWPPATRCCRTVRRCS